MPARSTSRSRNPSTQFLAISLLYFLITFAFHILKDLKDALIVTAEFSGAEVIPFIKVWGMLPAAILSTAIFLRLVHRYQLEKAIYISIGTLLLFFLLFAVCIFPRSQNLHADRLAHFLGAYLPEGFKGLIAMLRYWSFTLFYLMAELWSTIVLSISFWAFANEVSSIDDAKRNYPIYALIGNASGMLSGPLSIYLSARSYQAALPFGTDAWQQTVMLLLGVVLICGISILGLFRWLYMQTNTPLSDTKSEQPNKKREKMSFVGSIKWVAQSKYLLCVALMVLGYHITVNIVEVLWKDQVRTLFVGEPARYYAYMNTTTFIIGVLSCLGAILMSLRHKHLSWSVIAMITPLMLLGTAIPYYGATVFSPYLEGCLGSLTETPALFYVAGLGSIQIILARSAKYTVFDTSKELALIPLAADARMKGKAAIDGLGSRVGKSGASLLQQGLILSCGSVAASAPFTGIVVLAVIASSIAATSYLCREIDGEKTLELVPAA